MIECRLFEFFPSSSSLILIAFGLDKHFFHVTRVTSMTRVSNRFVCRTNTIVLLPNGPCVGSYDNNSRAAVLRSLNDLNYFLSAEMANKLSRCFMMKHRLNF